MCCGVQQRCLVNLVPHLLDIHVLNHEPNYSYSCGLGLPGKPPKKKTHLVLNLRGGVEWSNKIV